MATLTLDIMMANGNSKSHKDMPMVPKGFTEVVKITIHLYISTHLQNCFLKDLKHVLKMLVDGLIPFLIIILKGKPLMKTL